MRLARICMRAIDHHLFAKSDFLECGACGRHAFAIVIRSFLAPAQDDVRVRVATRFEDRGHAHLGHAHERVACMCRDDCVCRDLYGAVGAVLEADRAAESRSQLPMALALCRTCTDSAP